MPKFPHFADRTSQISGSVFEKFAPKMAAKGEDLMRLHIGDTYLPVGYDLPIPREKLGEYKDYNRYCNTFGMPSLRELLAEKLRLENDLDVRLQNILITTGCTNALSVSMMALAQPQDEVIVLTPAWPFFFGMVKIAGAKMIEAPLYMQLFDEPNFDVAGHIEQFISSRTAAIYLNTPNNPSGKVMTKKQIEQVAAVAKQHNLWVISDEAYDGLTFDARPHISIASLPGMFERTITTFTFSKSFMFAGLRLGYAVATDTVVKNLNKMMVHQLYSPSTIAQQMMVEPVQTRKTWLPKVRTHYQELRDLFVNELRVAFPCPEGTYFIFFPVDRYLGNRDYWQVIEACLDSGVSIAPGDSFGKDYGNFIRLCFTGEPPERSRIGIDRLNRILAV